jgi:AraC-like DNA-binding protein
MSHFFADIPLLRAPNFALPHLGLQWFNPPVTLTPWVQCLWHAHYSGESAAPSETLHWDGGTTLFIYFDKNNLPRIMFNALHSIQTISFNPNVDYLGVRFYPGGAFQLLNLPMADLIDSSTEATLLKLPNIETLQLSLADTHTPQNRISLVENWLLHLANLHQPESGLVQRLLPQLINATSSVENIVTQENLHRRKLERVFQHEIGVSPNKIKMLYRIKQARAMIKEAPGKSLTDVAIAAGFFDQAHFNRQFQQITGQTPCHYKKKKMSQLYNSQNT